MENLKADKLVTPNQPERLSEGRGSDGPEDGTSHRSFVFKKMKGVMKLYGGGRVVRDSLGIETMWYIHTMEYC